MQVSYQVLSVFCTCVYWDALIYEFKISVLLRYSSVSITSRASIIHQACNNLTWLLLAVMRMNECVNEFACALWVGLTLLFFLVGEQAYIHLQVTQCRHPKELVL